MDKTLTMLISRSKLFREGLKSLLRESPFAVTREASDARAASAQVLATDGEQAPELVVFDLPTDFTLAREELLHLREELGEVPIVVLADNVAPNRLTECLLSGASGYLMKDISSGALLQSLRLVLLGEKVFPTELAAMIINGTAHMPQMDKASLDALGLSGREIEILQCLVSGDSNKVIAHRLAMTEATVKVHMKNLLRKIKASNRTQAAIWALNHGVEDRSVEHCGL